MLVFVTLLITAIVGYAFCREGVLTAITMLVNVLIAGLIAFNFFEPLAAELEPMLKGSFLEGYEDSLCLVLFFSVTLALLRWATNNLANEELDLDSKAQQALAGLFGLITGYLLAGFLTCVIQTVPAHENVLGFKPEVNLTAGDQKMRRLIPPDRVWLGVMNFASRVGLSRGEAGEFDRDGTFEIRYFRHKRFSDGRDAMPYQGEPYQTPKGP
jgi:Colicin V production protein